MVVGNVKAMFMVVVTVCKLRCATLCVSVWSWIPSSWKTTHTHTHSL